MNSPVVRVDHRGTGQRGPGCLGAEWTLPLQANWCWTETRATGETIGNGVRGSGGDWS
jgi:hypothetical protein